MVHPAVRRRDPLWGSALIVEARDLPAFGVRRKPEREAGTAYYLTRARITACCGARSAAVLEITIDSHQGETRQFVATACAFAHELIGRQLLILFGVHEGPREANGTRRLHIHVLQTFVDTVVPDRHDDLEQVA